VVAVTTYLADIAQNVAGERLTVTSLIPEGSDSHAFEPSPQDAKLLAESSIIIRDVKGLTPLIDDLIESSTDQGHVVVDAAAGLKGLPANEEYEAPQEGETTGETEASQEGDASGTGPVDPHFWLDPISVIAYVENIRQAFAAADPDGADVYATNASRYTSQLEQLDAWIREQVAQIPLDRRLMVTNHEEFGYFAARYGFRLVGAVFPGVSSEGSPSAQDLTTLVEQIRATGAPAIFIEAGSTGDLAGEVSRETGATVVGDLHTHSLTAEAPTYIDMMRWNVNRIVEALR
jgi:ABC-type Zn uptake system ZnuABC Zn-binding protein ZnuA